MGAVRMHVLSLSLPSSNALHCPGWQRLGVSPPHTQRMFVSSWPRTCGGRRALDDGRGG